jgi:hypothetical protein
MDATKDSVNEELCHDDSHATHTTRVATSDERSRRSFARIAHDRRELSNERNSDGSVTERTPERTNSHARARERNLRATVRMRSTRVRRVHSRVTRSGNLDPDILEHSASP